MTNLIYNIPQIQHNY